MNWSDMNDIDNDDNDDDNDDDDDDLVYMYKLWNSRNFCFKLLS